LLVNVVSLNSLLFHFEFRVIVLVNPTSDDRQMMHNKSI
jgi:hypothetical protein